MLAPILKLKNPTCAAGGGGGGGAGGSIHGNTPGNSSLACDSVSTMPSGGTGANAGSPGQGGAKPSF